MLFQLQYDVSVRRSLPAWVALLGTLGLLGLFASRAQAQVNGPPASVTSPGFGGRPINGTRTSVTSVGPNGYAPSPRFFGFDNDAGHRRHHHDSYFPPVVYAIPLPYAVDLGASEEDTAEAEETEAEYQGGPTVYDRRGAGQSSYMPAPHDAPRAHPSEHAEHSEEPVPAAAPDPLEPTLLVFKDGHKLEVGNYAIIGQTLFDMTPGHARKVPIKDLDLEATRRANDDRGVTFELPKTSRAN